MCSVSVVHDYWSKNTKTSQWSQQDLTDYKEVIRLLDKLDKRLGQLECEDPAKAAWMREVEKRLQGLEDPCQTSTIPGTVCSRGGIGCPVNHD